MNPRIFKTTIRRTALATVLAVGGLLVGCATERQKEVAKSDPAAAEVAANVPTARPYRTFYHTSGKDSGEPATIPPVLLTDAHKALCQIGVGDEMPAVELPQLGGRRAKLADFYGKKATVVVFWKSDRRMALTELADLGPDVVEPFQSEGVAVVGIAVGESASSARSVVRQTGAKFPNLIDTDGAAFAKVGSDKLPRTYLLDSSGQVLWFDIEYSQTTRRELAQSLEAIVGRE